MNDLRFAFRQLRKGPAFTVTALATVAICLGANLAIFAVIDAILLRPLPFPESDRLVTIFNTYPKAGVERDGSSLTNYYERRGNIPAFSSLSIFRESTEVVGETGSTQQEKVMRVSPDFFTTLGAGPVMGRSFNEVETIAPIEHHAAIVTDAYWRQRLNADPHVLGREIRVNGAPRTIVGVLPPDFRFLSSEARLLLPLTSGLQQRTPEQRHSGGGGTHMIARLKPGATIAEAQSQIDAHNAAVEKGNPRAEHDGRGRLPLAGPSTPCGSRARDPSNPLVDAGRRVVSPDHGRGESRQPASDSRERAHEGNGDPPIDGRQPPACGESSDG